MVVLQHASGETCKLEVRADALIAWRYKPGTKKPRQTRVPLAACRDGSVQAELEHHRQGMLDRGYWESRGDDQLSDDQALALSFTVEGVVFKGLLPQELQRVATEEDNRLVLRPKGLNPIELPTGNGSGRRTPNSSGTQSTLEGLVMLLRIQDAIDRSDSTATMRIVFETDNAQIIEQITPKNALKRWPELEPRLEEHGLVLSNRLNSPAALDWFF